VADQGGVQSVERAAALLRAFLTGPAEQRVSDLAQATGVGQSTASRLLATLEGLGLVERDSVSGLYRLGLEHLSFASVALNHHPVHREGRQVVQELASQRGLGGNLAVRDGTSLLYLCNFEGRLAPKSFSLIGQRNPLHATGLGKCLLSGLSARERRNLLGRRLPAYTKHTVTTHDDLDAHVAGVVTRGYATEVEELSLGRACIAAPIRGANGDVVAALSLSGPLSAIDIAGREETLAGQVIEAADSIATGLGYIVTPGLQAGVRETRQRRRLRSPG
jgi:DNA-binding IclR family transcriptional regulator